MLDGIGRATRNAHLWLPDYLASQWRRRNEKPPGHLWVVIADHFEPQWQRPPLEVASERVARWRRGWPEIAARHRDDDGRPPCYSFFYPQEEYRPELLDPLAEMVAAGIADVEVHIHHDGGGEQEFLDRMGRFIETLSTRHALLRRHEGRLVFGFIHGNWALDNARPDGRWCGLNNELTLLRDLGCYADFTMPAAPNPSQGGPVNLIYRVTDDPERPRSFERGVAVVPGLPALGDLTMIPGPLVVDFEGRFFMKPRIDTGELARYHRPSLHRAEAWFRAAPRIGDHAFLKVFTHGAQEGNAESLLGGDLDTLFGALRAVSSAAGTSLHFSSAWQMWRAVEALRLGLDPLGERGR